MKIDISKWEDVNLSDIFNIKKGSRLVIPNRILGTIPFVTAGYVEEGISAYISNRENITFKDKITIDMFGNTFYRDYEFKCDDNILVLIPKIKINNNALLFLCTIISCDKYRYAYGKQYRQKDFYKHKIRIPITSNGSPDFKYMEKYIKSLHCKPITTKVKKQKIILDSSNWGEFKLEDIFNISSSQDSNLQNSEKGVTPYISSTSGNNGVSANIEAFPTQDANTITIARNGSVGSAFYQNEKFCASPDDIRILTPKFKMNKYSALFMTTIISQEKYKYAYGRKMGTKRIKNLLLKLPIKKDKTPDFEFMENYIKSLSYSDRI